MTDLWTKLKQTGKPVAVYGTGNGADKLFSRLSSLGIEVVGVFASDGFVRSRNFHGFPVRSFDDTYAENTDMTVLTAFGTCREEVIENILRISDKCELYAPDIPVFGDEFFDGKLYAEHKPELDFVRSRLCDENSVHVFDSIVNYKLSGELRYLFDCESTKDEAYENIVKPDDSEIFVDLGAYRGDTVSEFLKHSGKYRYIYAVEPDKKTYKKLTINVPTVNVSCINAATGADSHTCGFISCGGRGSHIAPNGEPTDIITVDDLLDGRPATYIKMDVEGAEHDAILGARQTIRNYKPKMKIAAYHRSRDVFDIVKTVLSIRKDYKIYMRHHRYIPAWDTDFYFI